jgi:hypothetical protein
MSINLDLDKRDLAIEQIRKRIKEMDNELHNVYEKIKLKKNEDNINNNNEILNEYETLFKDEENIKKKQIKKLKELYNYINKNNKNNKNNKKNTTEDKNEILNEINKIENLLLRK